MTNEQQKDTTHLSCHICSREALANSGFCDEHLLEYEARQREGVETEELDYRWSDTLDNWRERPTTLDNEIGARKLSSPLLFRGRHGNWLLFIRRYQTRLMDGLTVNSRTGETRRFVNVSEVVMWEDIQGERSAPYQTELASFWGEPYLPKVREKWEQQFLNTNGRVLLSKLASAAPFPIYGLPGHPLGFSLCNLFSWGSSDYQLREITFTFCSPSFLEEGDKQCIFELTSFDAKRYNFALGLQSSAEDPKLNPSDQLFQRYHLSTQERILAGTPYIWNGNFSIGNVLFSGEIRYWSQPYRFFLFELHTEETVLVGSAAGISYEEFLQMLRGLEVINHRSDLLTQYQQEIDK